MKTGREVWKATRDELPSWGTPTVYLGKGRAELATNASNFIRAYDPATGKELWRLGGSSKITAPTPVFADGLIVVASGRRPEAPIFVLRPGATGDITLTAGQTTNAHVVWSKTARGSYMPTPLVYGQHLYVLNNNGYRCYDLKTARKSTASDPESGRRLQCRARRRRRQDLSCGRGRRHLRRPRRPKFELLATNPVGETAHGHPPSLGHDVRPARTTPVRMGAEGNPHLQVRGLGGEFRKGG